ncbi:hypothetical protein GCM10010492_53850 [Saccharothrix mutabilis subsp. mutabilis]|uniref:Phosphoribosyltransferase n=1 Tax=Saccharothrix mutabilis subsp. mutabilis TaxID=66855 RepID=A0ABN0UDV7_9PSEU
MRPDVGESRVRTVGPGLHIVENEPLERILFERGLIGLPHRRACFAASRLFLAHLADDLTDAAELLILSKGLAYQLAAAADSVEIDLPTNLVATTRVDVVADDAKIDVSYARFDAGKPCLVVGDTVASGATVVAALDAYRQVHRLERLFLLSYAGSAVGARRIAEFCARSRIECTILYGLAAFGLGANGFDLSFTHPDTVTADVYRERARRLYGDRQVSSVGWDFGSQSMAPDKYRELSWLEARAHGLLDSPEFSFAREPRDLARLARESAAFGDPVDPC